MFSDIIILVSLLIGIITLFASGYFISRYMDYLINEKRFNAIIVGILCSILILTLGILAGSSVMAFVYSHPSNSIDKVLLDYYYFPLVIIFMVGGIPTIILGSILGKIIKN